MPTVHVPTRGAGGAPWGEPDPSWTPLAQDVFRALAASQQASLAQPSDVAVAQFICISMTRTLQQTRFSPTAFAAIVDALGDLGATIGSRLRLRLDLERDARPQPEGESLVLKTLRGGRD
ncbi:MAG: hypothetical protein ACLQT7_04800 [Candidatus Dormibacteria bacterium]